MLGDLLLAVLFLAAYTAVNPIPIRAGHRFNFLAAYTAVNLDAASGEPGILFLAAYTAVNKTKKPSTFQAPRAPAPKPGKTLFL
ncbi:hypothetical protein QOZ09_32700, partial [Pseudomonas aeruginosa]|uniref:hypothetical protein n=1 Tax=Pseudomonas aeruginosa TaxID=287 RepID=UPI0034585D64